VTFRHFLKQILQPLPGFAGMFQRRQQLREHARTIESLRTQAAEQNSAIDLLRTRAAEKDGEVTSLRAHAAEQDSEVAVLRMRSAEQDGEIASQRACAAEQEGVLASLRAQTEEQSSEIASLREQLTAVHAEAAAGEAESVAARHLQWKDLPHLEKQGLFVVGHARAGTSILMQALNTSPDIFLLGEANLHVEGLRIGFPRWFNEMHRQFGNTLAKDSYCPMMADPDANGPETLQWLGQRFRYVGEKVAFRSETLGYSPIGFFEFHTRHFFTSHYICIVRNPADVLKSNDDMFKPENLAIYADSYLQTLQLILELVATFPNVTVLFHENINQATFDTLGEWLSVDLNSAFALYEGHYQKEGRWGEDNAHLPLIDTLIDAHRRVREVFSRDTLRPLLSREWKMLPRYIRAMRGEATAPVPAPERAVDLNESPTSAGD